MIIKRKEAMDVFKAAGLKCSKKWSDKKLLEKLKDLPDKLDEGIIFDDPKIEKIVDALFEEEDIVLGDVVDEVVNDDEKEGKKKKKKTTKKKEKIEKTRTTSTKKVGVIKNILRLIEEDGPISKENILKELKKLFPDRNEKGMKNTISIQVPKRLSISKNVKIEMNDNKEFYIGKKTTEKKAAKKKVTKKAAKKKVTKKAAKKKVTKKKK